MQTSMCKAPFSLDPLHLHGWANSASSISPIHNGCKSLYCITLESCVNSLYSIFRPWIDIPCQVLLRLLERGQPYLGSGGGGRGHVLGLQPVLGNRTLLQG